MKEYFKLSRNALISLVFFVAMQVSGTLTLKLFAHDCENITHCNDGQQIYYCCDGTCCKTGEICVNNTCKDIKKTTCFERIKNIETAISQLEDYLTMLILENPPNLAEVSKVRILLARLRAELGYWKDHCPEEGEIPNQINSSPKPPGNP